MKIKTIPQAAGIIYTVTVVALIILGKRDWADHAVFWPVFLLLLYGFIVFVFSLITVPLYWITLPFRKYFIKKGKLTEQYDAKIKPVFVTATLVVALYAFYRCFFPSDDAIWNDFKKGTYRDPYPSARIIAKDSDFFSECTSAIIQMAPKHYMKLLNQIQNDHRFESNRVFGKYNSFYETVEGYSKAHIIHAFEYPHIESGTNYSFYRISFFANQKWVIYRYCV
jgi:hypothetical protein